MAAKRREAHSFKFDKSLCDLRFALALPQVVVLVDENGVVFLHWKRPKK